MSERVDVAIVGAGFGGLALAALCSDAGMSVAVIERRDALAPEGVGLVLQPNGLAVLDRLGVLDGVLAAGQRIDDVEQRDPSGHVRARVTYNELDHPHPYLVAVERTSVIALLAERAPALRLDLPVSALERRSDRVTGVRCGDELIEADLVVGADGRNSAVREALGLRSRFETGPDRYLIAVAPLPPPHAAGVMYMGDGWADGVLPLRERTYVFDHLVGESAAAVDRGDFGAWRDVYARRVQGGDAIADALGSFDAVGFLSGRTHLTAPRAVPGAVLIGDAAAAVHPHNGQGANRALADAEALAAALGEGTGEALARYARRRDAKARQAVAWSIFIGRTMDGPSAFWKASRRFGYLSSHVPPLRKQATRNQAGLA